MIPPADTLLTIEEQRRWEFTRLAAALILAGVSEHTVMLDAREGITMARRT